MKLEIMFFYYKIYLDLNSLTFVSVKFFADRLQLSTFEAVLVVRVLLDDDAEKYDLRAEPKTIINRCERVIITKTNPKQFINNVKLN